MLTVISSLVSSSTTERETNRDDRCTKKMHISEKGYIKREEEEELKGKNILDGLAIRLPSLM